MTQTKAPEETSPSGQPDNPLAVEQKAPLHAWIALALLTAAYAVAFLDRVIISLMVDPIRAGLAISDAQIGLLQGLAFSLVYSLLGIPLGLAADKYNRIVILVCGMLVWSVANMSCGLATSFGELFLARSLVGVGEAALAPVAASLLAGMFPPSQRGIAFGIYVGGNSIGAILALSLGGQLLSLSETLIADFPALLGGFDAWNVVFFATGLPGLVIAMLAPLVLREPRSKRSRRAAAARQEPAFVAPHDKKDVPYRLLTFMLLGGVFIATCPYAMISWFPTLLMRRHELTVDETGLYFGLSSMGVGFFSSLVSGWVIAFLVNRGRKDAPLITAMAAGTAYLLFGWLACFAGNPWLALGMSALISVFSNWITPSMLTAITMVSPAQRVGTIVAVYTMLTGLLSNSIGAAVPGFLSTGLFSQMGGIVPSLAVVYGGSSFIGIMLFLSVRHRFVREQGKAPA